MIYERVSVVEMPKAAEAFLLRGAEASISLHAGMPPYRTPLTGCGICVKIVPSFIIKPRRATARMWNFKVNPITFRHRTDS